MTTNWHFHAQCSLIESALRSLPYVTFVDALPTQSKPNENSVIVAVDVPLSMTHICEIFAIVKEHIGEQRDFGVEVGASTIVLTHLKYNIDFHVAACTFAISGF